MQPHGQDHRQRILILTFNLRVLMYIFPAQSLSALSMSVLGLTNTEFTEHFRKSTFSETNWPILQPWKLMQSSEATLTSLSAWQYSFKTRARNHRVLLSLYLSFCNFPYRHHFPLHTHTFTANHICWCYTSKKNQDLPGLTLQERFHVKNTEIHPVRSLE